MGGMTENTLSKIIGYRFAELGRAGGTIWLGFGDEKEIIIPSHNQFKKHTVNELAIHVECTFRIKQENHILLGNQDMFEPTSEYININDFNWDVQGANQFDCKAIEINKYLSTNNVNVIDYNLSDGDLYIYLSDGKVLEILINTSLELECWRFFEPGTNNPHIVATGTGIQNG